MSQFLLYLKLENMNAQFSDRFPPCNSEWTQDKGYFINFEQ